MKISLIKVILVLTVLFMVPFFTFSQEITEENYLKIDKEIWDTSELEMTKISDYYKSHPDKKDSLKAVSKQVYDVANKKNRDAAIKYASVPSGLKRLFMVRLGLSKDTLLSILKSLPQEMQESDYGKSILLHINSKQIEEGDKYYAFEAVDSDGNNFQLSSLAGKNILLLYGGLDCMGESGRDYLKQLYNETERTKFQIVVYWNCSDLEQLKALKAKYSFDYLFVSDFLKDKSPVKINYGAQATPTCFLIDKEGTVVIKSVGLPEERLTELKVENKLE